MNDIIQGLKRRMQELRAEMRQNRAHLIAEASELLEAGLVTDEVYLELRDRYIDSIPAIVDAADRAVDWDDVLRGVPGDLLEAIDGQVVDTLLRLVVRAADRRRRRRKAGKVVLGDLLRRSPVPVRDVTPAPAPAPEPAEDELAPSRSGGLASWDDGMDGPI
jgi:hypothetical protein